MQNITQADIITYVEEAVSLSEGTYDVAAIATKIWMDVIEHPATRADLDAIEHDTFWAIVTDNAL